MTIEKSRKYRGADNPTNPHQKHVMNMIKAGRTSSKNTGGKSPDFKPRGKRGSR